MTDRWDERRARQGEGGTVRALAAYVAQWVGWAEAQEVAI